MRVERLGAGDVVAFAQCVALDVTIFPHPSIPELEPGKAIPRIWIARRGVEVTGFVVARRAGGVLEITGLAVTPAQRRRGVGRALVRAAVDGARQARLAGVALQVSTANAAALALYAGEGFQRVKMLDRYYRAEERFGDSGNAWAMLLQLR